MTMTTFRGAEMVAVLDAPAARRRLMAVDDHAVVLTADRLTLAPRLPCHECVREPVCYIRRSIGPHSLDAVLPAQVHPALTMHVYAEAECELFVASEDMAAAVGPDLPWHERALGLGAAFLIGIVVTAAALLSNIVHIPLR